MLLSGIFLISDGVKINEQTNWKPVYELYFVSYLIVVNAILSLIPSLILSIETYKRFNDPTLKKKYLYYFSGLYLLFFVYYTTVIFNYLNNPELDVIYFIIGVMALPSAYLMYYGINEL